MNDSYSQWLARRREESKLAYAALMKFYPLTLEDLPGEIWKPIPDYEDYQISTFGRVKSFKRGAQKILKPMIGRGYLRIALTKNGKTKIFSVHRLVTLAFIPNPQNKPQINHIDGCKLNNFVDNLEWMTASENTKHAHDNGLATSGEDCYQAKLTAEQVQYIRKNPDALNQYKLANLFSVTLTTISKIQLGKIYKKAGGVIRSKKQSGSPRIPDDIRAQIRAEYVFGSHEFGSYALAKKYGIGETTVLNIVHE